MGSAIDKTLRHVQFYVRRLQGSDTVCVVIAVLIELGFETHWDGFGYLKFAICRYAERPGRLHKDIYPYVSEIYSSDPTIQIIDSAIKSAIDMASSRKDDKVWSYYFPKDSDGNIRKPSNGEFITRIAAFVELWQGCCKEERVCQTEK